MPSCHLVHDLPPFDAQHHLRVVVETPRGANIKIKYDEDLGCLSLSRLLPLGVTDLPLPAPPEQVWRAIQDAKGNKAQ